MFSNYYLEFPLPYAKSSSPNSSKQTNCDSEQQTKYPEFPAAVQNEKVLGSIIKKENIKLKNQLCRNFVRFGCCRYGSKCQFAHGVDELRKNENQNSKYKTKKCLTFFRDGFCMYGARCNFLHNCSDQKPQQKKLTVYQIYQNHPDLIIPQRKRLDFFKMLEHNS